MKPSDRKLAKRKRREERLRQTKHRQRLHPAFASPDVPEPHRPEKDPAVALPRIARASIPSMERTLRGMRRLVEQSGLSKTEDINRLLTGHDFNSGSDSVDFEGDAAEEAQDLAYEAMEASPRRRLELCRRALELDPDCVDARVMLAKLETGSPESLVSAMEEAIAAGERGLGAEFFEENRGHFWGLIETRPYMRARHEVAMLLRQLGRTDEAISHLEALLDLNPNDNQGARDELLDGYLTRGDLAGAGRLLTQFEKDTSGVFLWGRALAHFLAGDLDRAETARVAARAENAYVEDYLAGRRHIPAPLPDHYSPGHESEAWMCAITLAGTLDAHPRAVAWLRGAP